MIHEVVDLRVSGFLTMPVLAASFTCNCLEDPFVGSRDTRQRMNLLGSWQR